MGHYCLSRQEHTIEGYRHQKHFLQRIASTSFGTSIPLLYPEGMLFPSIFWKQMLHDGSIIGATPSSLLSQNNSIYGFESLKNLAHSRVTSIISATSTNAAYIAFQYDLLCNVSMNRSHSKIIINRGLMTETNEIGLRLNEKDDTTFSSCIDSKQIVKNLCASQQYHHMSFFYIYLQSSRTL